MMRNLRDTYADLPIVEDADDRPANPTDNTVFGEILERRLSRRQALRGLGTAAVTAGLAGSMVSTLAMRAAAAATGPALTFTELAHGVDENMHVAQGYRADVVIRWGDKVLGDAPAFQAGAQDAGGQSRQFGYNNDYIGYFPLPTGSNNSEHGLLVVNHEYTNAELMFPGVLKKTKNDQVTAEQAAIEIEAHGCSVIEVKKQDGRWQVVENSPYARRITGTTPIKVVGPAAGHEWMKTSGDATGRLVLGTLNNCAGGKTPWGTVMIGEENFNGYFGGPAETLPDAAQYKRYGISSKSWYAWWKYVDRFDVSKEPNEPNRFGWMVEFDPYDPTSLPVKRTALGRFKHEGATAAVNGDGRLVVYSGDDQRFDYLYRFVSDGRFNSHQRAANAALLDAGTLFVAKFSEDGTLRWLPLVFGTGPLTPENGFTSQADVLIETRRAADLLGATPLDRPEDVEPNPATGRVYVALTNNSKRKPDDTNAVNPRGPNPFGHIIELLPPGDDGARDHAALEFEWDIFILAGNPGDASHEALYNSKVSENGWFAAPDNVAFDPHGRLWVATDQGKHWKKTGFADGVYACQTTGPDRALTQQIFRVPIGAEMCGPEFTPDGKTLFVAVQHPAADGVAPEQNFDNPATRWPDFQAGVPPRPSLVAITKEDGGDIGS